MVKTQDELNQLKTEYETLTTKLQELSEDELKVVTGGLEYKFIGLFEPFIGMLNPDDQQIVGELPKMPDIERYVK